MTAERKKIRNRRVYAQRIAFARHMLGGVCVVCGRDEFLEFDHIDPSTKLVELNQAASISLERFMAEIPKCQLLCHGCHVKKSCVDGTKQGGQYKIAAVIHMEDDEDDCIPALGGI